MATMADPSEFMTAFAQFISSSPTSYHAAETMSALLDRAGFEAMDEKLPWTGVAGRRYFVRGGAVVAWIASSPPPGSASWACTRIRRR